jgi:hypothetical protein
MMSRQHCARVRYRRLAVSVVVSPRHVAFVAALGSLLLLLTSATQAATAARPHAKAEKPKEPKAWVNGKGMCVFPFAAEDLPDNAGDFAAAMSRGYRKAIKLPDDSSVVTAEGGVYPKVDSLKIDVCDAVIDPERKARKPSDRKPTAPALDAAHFEMLGHRMSVERAIVNMDLTATDARLLLAQDDKGKPLLVLGGAKNGRMSMEVTLDDVERLLLVAARKGGRSYGLAVDRARLDITVDETGHVVRVDLKLSTRLGPVPAGLRLRARLDIDDKLNGKLSELAVTGDDVLGPLMSGLIRPFLAKYNGTTRPLMNFPATEMRLRGIEIAADRSIRVKADFGN